MIKRGWRAILSVFLLLLIISLTQNVVKLVNRGLILRRERAKLEVLKKEGQVLEAKLDYMKTDDFLEREARDNLGLIKEGETVIILPSAHGGQDGKSQATNNQGVSNWEQWWRLVYGQGRSRKY